MAVTKSLLRATFLRAAFLLGDVPGSVSSLEEYADKVVQYGGRVVMSKTPVKAFGYFAICLDPEGNAFGLWETDERAE